MSFGGGADDPSFSAFSSRWGIKGESEVSEGMTAVYRFESKITNAEGKDDPGQDNGNFAYVGLSGGFGSLTLGKQNNAAYNHSGALRDIGNWEGGGDTNGSKTANSLSYAFSAESVSMQINAVMDAAKDTGSAVDQVEFGLSVGLGDIGTVALGYEKVEDSMTPGMPMPIMPGTVASDTTAVVTLKEENGEVVATVAGTFRDGKNNVVDHDDIIIDTTATYAVVYYSNTEPTAGGSKNAVTAAQRLHMIGGKLYTAECRESQSGCTNKKIVTIGTAYPAAANTSPTAANADGVPYIASVYDDSALAAAAYSAKRAAMDVITYGHKASHISASFGLAGVTLALGHTTKDSNSSMMNDKIKTNFLGASGGIGDTGLSWNAWGRSVKNHEHKKGDDRSPWAIGLAKSLGGGAKAFIEHGNADDGNDGTTSVALRVDF